MNCYELDTLSRTNVSAINNKEFFSPCVFIINIRHRKKVLITLLQNKAELRSTGIYFFEAEKPTDVSTNVRNFQDFHVHALCAALAALSIETKIPRT